MFFVFVSRRFAVARFLFAAFCCLLVVNQTSSAQCDADILSLRGGLTSAASGETNRLYVGAINEFRIIDTTNPAAPVQLASLLLPGTPEHIEVGGSTAYLAMRDLGAFVVNISNPAAPFVIATIPAARVLDLAVSDDVLYVVDGIDTSLEAWDVSTPGAPSFLSTYNPGGFPVWYVEARASTVFVGDAGGRVRSLNYAAPSVPVLLDTISTAGGVFDMDIRIGLLAAAGAGGIEIIDISNPASLSSLSVVAAGLNSPVVFGQSAGVPVLYHTNLLSSLVCTTLANPASPAFGSVIRTNLPFPFSGIYQCHAVGSRLYTSLFASFQIYDMIVPTSPDLVLDAIVVPYSTESMAVLGDHLITLEDDRLITFDTSNPAAPTFASSVALAPFTIGFDVESTRAYVADSNTGLRTYNYTNPAAPALLGTSAVADDLRSLRIEGTTAYFTDDHDLFVYDVSDPGVSILRGRVQLGNFSSGDIISAERGTVVIGDDFDDVILVDVSDAANPVVVATLSPRSGETIEDISVHDGILCLLQSDERIDIYDITNPASPTLRSNFTMINAASLTLAGSILMVCDTDGLARFSDIARPSSPALLLGTVSLAGDPDVFAAGNGTIYTARDANGICAIRLPGLPRIDTAPTDTAVCTGQAQLSVVLSNPIAASYQWRREGIDLVNGINGQGTTIAGAVSSTLVLTNLTPAQYMNYDCVVTNPCGTSTTRTVDLSLGIAPFIVNQPDTSLVCPDAGVTFTIGWLGSNPASIQWEWQSPPGSGVWTSIVDGIRPRFTISGATTRSLTIAARPGETLPPAFVQTSYRCTVTNACGATTSQAASLTLCPADYNCDGFVNSQDFFDFIAAFFALSLASDFNSDGVINSQDYFDFLSAFFAGC